MSACRSPANRQPPLEELFRLEEMAAKQGYLDEDGDEMYVAVPYWWITRLAEEVRALQQGATASREG